MMTPIVSQGSQPDKLRREMREADVTHGATVRADIRNVQVRRASSADRFGGFLESPTIFFCDIERLRNVKFVKQGDGGELPAQAEVAGLRFPGPGDYDIFNALISSNGVLRVSADGQTTITPHSLIPAIAG